MIFFLVAEVGFFIALHRRIVVCRRLDASLTLGSAYSLRLVVSLRQKQHSVVFALLPTTSSVGREAQTSFSQPTKKGHRLVSFSLVAEVGFEPHDLRVMSPTSYQAALLRDIDFYGYRCGAGDRGRTGTILSYHGILSPGRLPIPPHRQIACQGSFLPLALSIITHLISAVKPFFAFP